MEKNIYTKFSNDRSEKFNIVTSITIDDDGRRHVYKKAASKKSNHHIERMKKNALQLQTLLTSTAFGVNGCSSSITGVAELEFIQGKSFEEELDEALLCDDNGICFLKLLSWYKEELYKIASREFIVSGQFEEVFLSKDFFDKENKDGTDSFFDINKKLYAAELTDIDLIFPNIIHTEKDGYIIIDYEWTFDCLIPIDFVIYRALFFYLAGERYDKVKKKLGTIDLVDYLDIPKELLPVFEKMEKSFQQYIARDNVPMWKLYNENAGMLYGIKGMAEKENSDKKKFEANLYVDERKIQTCKAMLSDGDCLMLIPVKSKNQKLIFNVGICQYRISGLFGFDINGNICACKYRTNGNKLCDDIYVTGDCHIELYIEDIPDGLNEIFLDYKIENTSLKTIVKELESVAQLELENGE
ncbi:hypothetical protein SAMN02910453_0473 [Lachnospiraceae bacterium A10]|nr:hypothetical protein SAMN02910453_0473 [Lachnospiraceae bacterium A10]